MANQNGSKYGFTGLFPISPGRSMELRSLLRSLDDPQDYPRGSPFSNVPIMHMARLFVLDRLAYQGTPAKVDTLSSDYLVFACDFDGDGVDALVRSLAENMVAESAAIWNCCVAFPGLDRRDRLAEYFEQCQVETTFLLADQPEARVNDILKGLLYRRRLAAFVRQVQRRPRKPEVIKRGFLRMWEHLQREQPLPGEL
jgi:hypothetical protein